MKIQAWELSCFGLTLATTGAIVIHRKMFQGLKNHCISCLLHFIIMEQAKGEKGAER